MNVQPAAVFEAVIEVGELGLVGTIGVEANDNAGATVIPFTSSGVAEIAPGVYAATGLVAPSDVGQNTLIWRRGVGGDVLGVDDLTVTAGAPVGPDAGATFITPEELFRVLKIRTPSDAQELAGQRVLAAAWREIVSECGTAYPADAPAETLSLLAEVQLERAVEHWQQSEAPFGVIGQGDSVPVMVARDSWDRHAHKLAPLKVSWGLS